MQHLNTADLQALPFEFHCCRYAKRQARRGREQWATVAVMSPDSE